MIYQPCHRCEESLPLKQIKEDRAYLEFLSLAGMGANADELDLQAVTQWASELKKRARRLQANLVLPETDGDWSTVSETAQVPTNRIDLAKTLILLSRLTSESLRNPILSGLLLDQALSAKAVRDFHQIEILAGSIQNACQMLSKAP